MNTQQLLGYDFNEQQQQALGLLASFIENNYINPKLTLSRPNIDNLDEEQKLLLSNYPRFLLTGSAGTGKSSLITYLIFASWYNIVPVKQSPNYILAAPTNKAKDVLKNKFTAICDKYLDTMKDDKQTITFKMKEKMTKLIQFKTLSQILGVNAQINKHGEQEFTKGNKDRISKKYNKADFNNCVIIIDECSMIDIECFKLVQSIPKPIIFLGDPCQLPPVNEDFSEIFRLPDFDKELYFYNLTEVMRSKNIITNCCNYMRDIILGLIKEYNEIKFDNIHHKYIKNDNKKQKNIKFYIKQPNKWFNRYVERCLCENIIYNDMGICYTNKRCNELNNRIRDKLYSKQFDNKNTDSTPYIMNNEKIIVKSPYFIYGSSCYNSLILRVISYSRVNYKPLSFIDWIKSNLNIMNKDVLSTELNNINLDEFINSEIERKNEKDKQKGTLFQFGFDNNSNGNNSKNTTNTKTEEEIMLEQKLKFSKIIREKLYTTHNFTDNKKKWFDYKTKTVIIPEDVINNDIFVKIYNIINDRNVDEVIKPSYTNIHQSLTEYTFGIPLDKISCSICTFFAPFMMELLKEKDYVAIQFAALTRNVTLCCYLCNCKDTLGNTYKLPIVDENSKDIYEDLKANAKKLLYSCINKKITISKEDSKSLRKNLTSEELEFLLSTLGNGNHYKGNIKSIPYSLMFGHFWNHIFIEPILDWDYGYFITTHKSQGSDYDEVFVDGNNLMRNTKKGEKDKLIYTGLSRAKSRLNIYI